MYSGVIWIERTKIRIMFYDVYLYIVGIICILAALGIVLVNFIFKKYFDKHHPELKKRITRIAVDIIIITVILDTVSVFFNRWICEIEQKCFCLIRLPIRLKCVVKSKALSRQAYAQVWLNQKEKIVIMFHQVYVWIAIIIAALAILEIVFVREIFGKYFDEHHPKLKKWLTVIMLCLVLVIALINLFISFNR